MSLKDLFDEQKNLKSLEPIKKDDFKEEVESFDYVSAINKRDARFVAIENFHDPSVFARFGSAEKYYHDSIQRIHNTYPYDGSLKEKVYWEISSSLLDLYLFENGYPRTTGYANFVNPSTTTGADVGAGDVTFMPPDGDDEYVLVKGGPHAGSGNSLYYDYLTDNVVYRKDANIHNLDDERESNLLIDGTRGNTVEFWLKKEAYDAASMPENIEFILDAHVTGTSYPASDNYGRLMVGLCTTGTIGNNDDQPIILEYASGSDSMELYLGAPSFTSASIADGKWHHYSIRVKTSGSNTVADLFVDGKHNFKNTYANTIGYVSGAIVATIGAQAAPFFAGVQERGQRGWSKFSGSIDEVRYWKTWRTSKQIQRYWFDQVGGGTNTDIANTDLGVYLKFNEGITLTSSIDSSVLDYSGRVSNGTWTGYSSNSRSTGSAINDCSLTSFSGSEFKDPVIYSFHPDVADYAAGMEASGTVYDDRNSNSLVSYIPNWIIEENETQNDIKDRNYLWNLLQIMSTYFDEAAILMDKLPELSHQKYYSGVANPPSFNKKALESSGFFIPDLFVDSTLLEKFEDRDEKIKFESTLQEVKNTIYQNIYNNLNHIYKTKGTEKSFRNLFHCFGFGDEILKFNIYGNNTVHKLEDNLKYASKNINFIDFNRIENGDATVYQYQIDSNSTSMLAKVNTSIDTDGLAFTAETNVILPDRVGIDEYSTVKEAYKTGQVSNLYPLAKEASIFGIHTATGTENDLTWLVADYANFQVYTVKDDLYSDSAYFKLSGTID